MNDSVGGVFEVIVLGLLPGLGSYVQADRRLDAQIAQAVMGIQAIKGVEFGMGFACGEHFGTNVHDEIYYNETKRFFRKTNASGGLEGGISTGEPLVTRAVMKPIPTVKKSLKTVDIVTKKSVPALHERSDVCAVPSAAIVAEAVIAIQIVTVFFEKFGGDCLFDIKESVATYAHRLRTF
ncbi:chorismate synthase [Chlamydiota bacterium]